MKKYVFLLLIILTFFGQSFAQQCGPGCPVCSGSGSSTGALVSSGTFIPNFLYIPNGEEETGVFNVRGGVTSWLDVGIGYTVEAEKTIWSARLQALEENVDSWKPSIIFGTGSVQTGGSDQSLFLQFTKSWEFNKIFAARISAGAASLMPDFEKMYGLAGLTLTITEQWSPFVSYDGINFHPGLAWIPTDWLNITAILVESEEPAISVGFRYGIMPE